MSKYLIQITDYSNNQFPLLINVPAWGGPTWQSIQKGWIRYNNGPGLIVDKSNNNPFMGNPYDMSFQRHKHLYICTSTWGIVLFDFLGWTDANDSGRGYLINQWAVYADSGPLGWSVTG